MRRCRHLPGRSWPTRSTAGIAIRPIQGISDLNLAIVEWLGRRYRLPAGLLDPTRHVMPTAGSKEGVYIIATVATPQQKNGARPVIAPPTHSTRPISAAPCCPVPKVNASAETGFLPDFDTVDYGRGSACRWSISCAGQSRKARRSPASTTCEADRQSAIYDACWRSTNATPRSRDPVGGARARWRWTIRRFGSVPQRRGVPPLSKRSNAAGLRSGFMVGDPRQVAMLRAGGPIWRPTDPFAVQKASAALRRDETHPLERGNGTGELPRRRGVDLHNRLRLPHAGRRLLPVARCR